jgi:hypothetical protein
LLGVASSLDLCDTDLECESLVVVEADLAAVDEARAEAVFPACDRLGGLPGRAKSPSS